MSVDSLSSAKLVTLIQNGGVGVLPTDTLYGIHASAMNKDAVERVYEIKGREKTKPFIILVSSIDDLKKFGIELDSKTETFLESIWPNPVSVVLPVEGERFKYLHPGQNSLAFRMPQKTDLLDLLKRTGPLVSTTVNPEGMEPAKTVAEAKKYFEEKLDFFVDQGRLEGKSSTLIKFENNKPVVLRQGSFILKA